MYIETQTGDLLAVEAIEVVHKPTLPEITVSDLFEYHQQGPQTRTIRVRTHSGETVEIYESRSVSEITLCFEIVRNYLIDQKLPHYQRAASKYLCLSVLETVISDLLEDFDSMILESYNGKTLKWAQQVSNVFDGFEHDLDACSVSVLLWQLAVVEMLIISNDNFGYTFTDEGITIPPK